MELRLLAIGLAATGMAATVNIASAMPAPSRDIIATTQSAATPVHYSARKHVHRGDRVVWLKRGEDMTTGRSVSQSGKHQKKNRNMDNASPSKSKDAR